MPVQFLSEAEHKSLNRFPSEVSSEDLNRFFLLSDILFHMACEHLKQQKILRIGTTILARMVATMRVKAQEINYHSLKNLLTTERSTWLDSLLEIKPDETRTPLSWLQRTPTGNNPKQILETLDKISFLQQSSVDTWDLSQLNPNRINHLAKIGARATNQYLQRASEVRRYPILICFLKQSLYNFTDDLIEMVDQRLWELYNQAKRNFDSDRLMASKTIDEKLKTLQDIGQILLNQDIEDNSVRVKTFEYITPDDLKVSLKETQQLIRLVLMGQVEELLNQPDSDLREERGSLVLSSFKADEKTLELKRLAEEITARLPRIEITDLLVEVDSWTDFSNAFEHLNQGQNQDYNSWLSLYSCLLAQACNLDFQQMATSTGLLYRRLCWFNN